MDQTYISFNIYFQIATVTTKRMGIVCATSDFTPVLNEKQKKRKNSVQNKKKKEKKKKKQKQRNKQKAHVILIHKDRL